MLRLPGHVTRQRGSVASLRPVDAAFVDENPGYADVIDAKRPGVVARRGAS